jgi:hypothetical protein
MVKSCVQLCTTSIVEGEAMDHTVADYTPVYRAYSTFMSSVFFTQCIHSVHLSISRSHGLHMEILLNFSMWIHYIPHDSSDDFPLG